MPDKITYYAIIGDDRTIDNPYGLVRRLSRPASVTAAGLCALGRWPRKRAVFPSRGGVVTMPCATAFS